MKALEAPDQYHLRAAQGWLELGDLPAAQTELEQLSGSARCHPLFLLVRWEIFVKRQHWEAAHWVAERLVQTCPEEPIGWLQRSYTLHVMKRTPEAFQQLLPAAHRFPKVSTVAYHLACYACQLGHVQEAWLWLDKAIASGEADRVKSMALEDPILAPLWQHLHD